MVNVYNRIFQGAHYCECLLEWLNSFWFKLQHFPTYRILIGGDFNTSLDSEDLEPQRKPGYEIMHDFLEETDLTDCWHVYNPTTHRNTFFRSTPQGVDSARLDYFFVSPLLLNYLYSVDIGLHYQSDHCPVYVSFFLNRNPCGLGIFRFPSYLLGDDTFCSELVTMIPQVVKHFATSSPSLLWQDFGIHFPFQISCSRI